MKVCVFALCLLLPAAIYSTDNSSSSFNSAHELALDLSSLSQTSRTFDIQSNITYLDEDGPDRIIALLDKTGNVVVYDHGLSKSRGLKIGDIIRCSGKVINTGYGRMALANRVRVIGYQQPQPALSASIDDLIKGKFDYKVIHVTGTIFDARRSETNPVWNLLTVTDGNNAINVSTRLPAEKLQPFAGLIGSRVYVEGICLPRESGPRRFLGRTIKAYAPAAVRLDRASPSTDFSDISSLKTASVDELNPFTRYQAEGRITATWGRQSLLTTTNALIVRLSFSDDNVPSAGEFINAVGYPETDLFNLGLSRVAWRQSKNTPLREHSPDAPTNCMFTASQSLRLQHLFHGKEISVSGTILTGPLVNENASYILLGHTDAATPVYVDPSWDTIKTLSVGTQVRITGICVLEAERWHPNFLYPKAQGFIIVTRTPDDISIIARPSWWTPQKTLIALGTLLAIICLFGIWNIVLRRISIQKGRELFNEQIDHATAELRTEERTRLAVELHDSLSQSLSGISMHIDSALRFQNRNEMVKKLLIAAQMLLSCREELRNCLWDLRHGALDAQTMNEAIRRTVKPQTGEAMLSIRFCVPRDEISENTTHAILRILRELASNAVRHGHATHIRIAGVYELGFFKMSVEDNGCGFDEERAPGINEGHFGLQGIRERLRSLGGSLTICSSIGNGTKIVMTIPRKLSQLNES